MHLWAVILVCLGALLLSCDEIERHRALTFFFDGVPPLGGEGLGTERLDVNAPETGPAGQKLVWYEHEPVKDCTNCHQKQAMGGFSPQTRLIAPAPQLCYKCHEDPATSAAFVHGPVAVGQCLFCHNPHRTKVEHLLTEAEPRLCYSCHDITMIGLIPAHLTQPTSACTDCHNPHAGPARFLLKTTSSEKQYEFRDVKPTVVTPPPQVLPVQPPQVVEPPKPAQTEDQGGQDRKNLLEVFAKVSRLIKQGKLQEARSLLEETRKSQALTQDERAKIEEVLRLMDSLSDNGAATPQNEPTAAEKSEDSVARQRQQVADLYYQSMAYYRDGQLGRARDGFVLVLNSGLIPPEMQNTIRAYIADIDRTLARDNQKK